jgi:hypothetical protein
MSMGPIQVGVADPSGTPVAIMADASAYPFTLPPQRVTLTKDFSRTPPSGWPADPGETGVDHAHLQHPRTVLAGTTLSTHACVASALIAADAATPA